jgi:hypothetical protein
VWSRQPGSFAISVISRRAVSRMNSSAIGSSVTPVTRRSNARRTRETSETSRIPAMKQAPIFTPSGRSATFAPVV